MSPDGHLLEDNSPRVQINTGYSDGYFGPLGRLDTPASVGAIGMQSTSKASLLGSAPASVLSQVGLISSRPLKLGVSGAGLFEAPSSSSPTLYVLTHAGMEISDEKTALAMFNSTLDNSKLPSPSAESCEVLVKELNDPISMLRKGKSKHNNGGKLKSSRKKKERPYSKKRDEETGDEDQREDDRIMALLENGASAEDIDRLYSGPSQTF